MGSSNISSCYKVDQSWANSTVLDVLTSVPDYEECRALCRDQVGCEGWTWISKASADYSEHCLIFSSLGDIENYPNCVSGPPSCLCSEIAACENTGDNEVDVLPNIFQEETCQELCATNPECGFYTWYDGTAGLLGNVCVLLSSCSERDSSCSSCHSAPVPCSQHVENTTTTTTTTSPAPTQGLIISGGQPWDSAGQSVEVYVPSTGQHCQLAELPDERVGHTMEKMTLCGGGYYSDTETSCLTLTDAGWEVTTTTLLEERSQHSSWDSPAGVILMGGYGSSGRTTEKILQDGTSTASFDLKYDIYAACAINMGT